MWPFTPLMTFVADNPPTYDDIFGNEVQAKINDIIRDQGQHLYGDGSDGSSVLDGAVAAPAWASKFGTVYSAARDFQAQDLTITGAGVRVRGQGSIARVNGTLTITAGGRLDVDGNAGGTGHTPGAATTTNVLNGGAAGANGGVAAVGSDAANLTDSFGGAGSNGGAGGGGGNAGGAGGLVTAVSVVAPGSGDSTCPKFTAGHPGVIIGNDSGLPPLFKGVCFFGGAGGGGGGSSGGGAGGAGGSGGGILYVFARKIVLDNDGDIRAKGGNGGATGGGFNGGGGGGGGGGCVVIVYRYLNKVLTAANTVPGGDAGGSNGGTGGPAAAGGLGKMFLVFG